MKIGIANDMAMAAEALRRVVLSNPDYEVIWIAKNGVEAAQLCQQKQPDVVLMDLFMPELNGVGAIRLIMRDSPCAILVVTSTPDDNTNEVFNALGAGAIDVVATPILSDTSGQLPDGAGLLRKLKNISKLIGFDRNGIKKEALSYSIESMIDSAQMNVKTLVVIGSSTGGPMALVKVLSGLPVIEHVAIVIVQHVDQRFAETFAGWLGGEVKWPVQTIKEGAALQGGHIVIAMTDDHVLLGHDACFSYRSEPVDYPYRPSIDVFFHSVAQHWKRKAIGILLTGMGKDGAKGLLALKQAGQLTIAQDKDSCTVYGMPRAAAEIDAAKRILTLEQIAATLSGLQ